MGFDLNAFLGRTSELRTWKTLVPSAVVCELSGDLGLVPITGELFHELRARLGEDEANRLDGAEGRLCYPLPSQVEAVRRWASEASASTTVAYVSIGEYGDMSHEEVTLWSDSQEIMSRVKVGAALKYFYNKAGFAFGNERIDLERYRGDDAPEKWAAAGVLDDLLRQADEPITALAQALRYEHRSERSQLLVRTFAANRLAEMSRFGEGLPPSSFVPLLTESGENAGVLLVHPKDIRDRLLQELSTFSAEDGPAHNGRISSFLFDQIGASAGIFNATVQSGGLVQVLASPTVAQGLRKGTLTIMRSGGAFTGNVVAQSSKAITAQLRFIPASCAPVTAPLIAWQILHAVAGVQQLARVNARLDSLERGLERLTFRQQARTMGKLAAAIAMLEDLSEQFRTSGSFTTDMIVRLALADRDIQYSLAEQRFLVQRFEQLSSRVMEGAKGKQCAISANQLLKEAAAEFLIDAKILITASKASLLSSQAWLRYDLEHDSANVPRRLKDLETELWNAREVVEPLTLIQELDDHAKQCVKEMKWYDRYLFSHGLANEVRGRRVQGDEEQGALHEPPAPSVLVWKGRDNRIQSVVVDYELTEGNTSESVEPTR